MADLSDVLNTLVNYVEQAVYPNGIIQPSVAGVDVTIGAGWPIRNVLDTQLIAGKAMVTVFPTNQERSVTTFQRILQPLTQATPTLVATVLNNTITITGTVSVPQAIMAFSNNVGYGYQVLITDTTSTIATALAALIPSASAVANVITITGVYQIDARVTTAHSSLEELNRQERIFMITCWSPTPTIRTLLGKAIKVSLDTLYRIPMIDDDYGHIWYKSTNETDILEKSLIYRRDLNYKIQYATTITQSATTITDPFLNSITYPVTE